MEFLDQMAAAPAASTDFPLMPEGQAVDMGHAEDGTPLFDPRIFDSPEFFRNPYPYYRILRDHYPVFHDRLHNCYWVTRYDDITECYFDDEGFNTIPKGSSSGVLGNTQLELSGGGAPPSAQSLRAASRWQSAEQPGAIHPAAGARHDRGVGCACSGPGRGLRC